MGVEVKANHVAELFAVGILACAIVDGCSTPTLAAKRAQIEKAEDAFCADVAAARRLEQLTGTLPDAGADAGK